MIRLEAARNPRGVWSWVASSGRLAVSWANLGAVKMVLPQVPQEGGPAHTGRDPAKSWAAPKITRSVSLCPVRSDFHSSKTSLPRGGRPPNPRLLIRTFKGRAEVISVNPTAWVSSMLWRKKTLLK